MPASATTVALGGLTLQSREVVAQGDQTETVYTGVLNTQPVRYVAVQFPAQVSAELRGVVESIRFSPTAEATAGATVIP